MCSSCSQTLGLWNLRFSIQNAMKGTSKAETRQNAQSSLRLVQVESFGWEKTFRIVKANGQAADVISVKRFHVT